MKFLWAIFFGFLAFICSCNAQGYGYGGYGGYGSQGGRMGYGRGPMMSGGRGQMGYGRGGYGGNMGYGGRGGRGGMMYGYI